MKREEGDLNANMAEFFDALGHPTRIRILKSLEKEPLGFSELKRAVGIDSNGLLAFHLGKIRGFVEESPDGKYALSDYGVEALQLSYVMEKSAGDNRGPFRISEALRRSPRERTILVALVLVLLVVAAFAGVTYLRPPPKVEIVSPLVLAPVTPAGNSFVLVPYYNATTTGGLSSIIEFRLNTTSSVTGSFTSTNGIDIFILPTDSEGIFWGSVQESLNSATGYTYTTGAVVAGSINTTLVAGSWAFVIINPSAENSGLIFTLPVQVLADCNTEPLCYPQLQVP